jgi:hypoxanthine phosphoribosyltransferase
MLTDIEKILFHESTIFSRLDELSQQITEDYRDKDITVISILNGSFIFMADLLRRIQLPLRLDCISVSSYHGQKSSGEITFRQNDILNVCNRHVLLLDDILDSGLTLHTIKEKIIDEGAASVKSCVLLRKDVKRKVNEEADYSGFTIGNEFVVGYGLDYNQDYRNLPFIGVLKKEAIKA